MIEGYPSNSLVRPMMGPMTPVMNMLLLQMTIFAILATKIIKKKIEDTKRPTGRYKKSLIIDKH
jgi:hypothetical protein